MRHRTPPAGDESIQHRIIDGLDRADAISNAVFSKVLPAPPHRPPPGVGVSTTVLSAASFQLVPPPPRRPHAPQPWALI